MRLFELVILVSMLAGGTNSAAAADGQHIQRADRAAFAELVKEYQEFVVPYCAPELVRAYNRINSQRDRTFVESLGEIDLRSFYHEAVREKRTRDHGIVRHCDPPPLPPPPPGVTDTQARRRAAAIKAEQERLRDAASRVPEYFDAADAVFAKMIALRDKIFGTKDH